jgi:hypothetical protein
MYPARTLAIGLSIGLSIGVAISAFADRAEAQRRRAGRLAITTSVEGAEVLVDEESVGFTPLEDAIELAAGNHTIRVRRPGYTEFTDVVRIRAGETVDLPVDLMALAMVLTVRSTPEEARVFVDGTFRGTTPTEVELIEGEHSIRVTHPGHRETVRTITATPGETQALDLELEVIPAEEIAAAHTTEWYEEPVVWISVGAGAVVVAIAIVLVAVLTSGGSQLDEYCGTLEMPTCIRVMPNWDF